MPYFVSELVSLRFGFSGTGRCSGKSIFRSESSSFTAENASSVHEKRSLVIQIFNKKSSDFLLNPF